MQPAWHNNIFYVFVGMRVSFTFYSYVSSTSPLCDAASSFISPFNNNQLCQREAVPNDLSFAPHCATLNFIPKDISGENDKWMDHHCDTTYRHMWRNIQTQKMRRKLPFSRSQIGITVLWGGVEKFLSKHILLNVTE